MQVNRPLGLPRSHEGPRVRRGISSGDNCFPSLPSDQKTRGPQHHQDLEHTHAPSQERDHPLQGRCSQVSCNCLQSIVHSLETLENRVDEIESQTIDSMLAYQKEALAHCSYMIRCPTCRTRSEHMALLGLVSDKLINSYEQIIANPKICTRKGDNEASGQGAGASSSSSWSSITAVSQSAAGAVAEENGPLSRSLSLGCYQIDRDVEWQCLTRALFTLQLRQTHGLLSRMQLLAEETSRRQQVSALKTKEQRLKNIIESFQHLAPS